MALTVTVDNRDKPLRDANGQLAYVNVTVNTSSGASGMAWYMMESDGNQDRFEARIKREANATAEKYAGSSGYAKVNVSDIRRY
jgi:hypothetical protein